MSHRYVTWATSLHPHLASPIKGEETISYRSEFPSPGGLRLLEPTARGGGVRGGGSKRAMASKHGGTTLAEMKREGKDNCMSAGGD